MLTMPQEIDVTLEALDSVLYECALDDFSVLLLLNGGESPDLRAKLSGVAKVEYFQSRENLGVAGGRAFLASQPTARAADIIVLLDNDLIVTTDYLREICRYLLEADRPGVIGATVLNYRTLLPYACSHAEMRPGPLGQVLPRITNRELRSYVEHHPTNQTFFHVGIDPDWINAYFPVPSLFESLRRMRNGRTGQRETVLARNAATLALYRTDGPDAIEVSNIAGCTQAFRRALYDDLGGIQEKYSPYGFEDADFCIRAIRAGYKNYTLTRVFSLHGTDDRHQERTELVGIWRATAVQRRSYGLLFRDHCPADRRWTLWARFFLKVAGDSAAILVRTARQLVALVLTIGATVLGYSRAYLSSRSQTRRS